MYSTYFWRIVRCGQTNYIHTRITTMIIEFEPLIKLYASAADNPHDVQTQAAQDIR